MIRTTIVNGTIVLNATLSGDVNTAANSSGGWVVSLLMESVSYAMIFVAFFGLTGNILIMITFVKIGFSESINISYCALCVSDLLCVVLFTWNAICFTPAFAKSGLPFIAREVVVPTGGATSDTFRNTTACITTFISLERCLCVAFPLKIKQIVSRKRTVSIIATLFAMTTLPLLGITFYIYVFDKKFDDKRNRTVIGVTYRNTALADTLYDVYFIYKMVFMTFIPLLIVSVCSVSLVIHLKRSASWRHGQSPNTTEKSDGSVALDDKVARRYSKEKRVARTVLAIAASFTSLETAGTLKLAVSLAWPEFHPVGTYGREYKFVSRFAFLCSLVNSSVNFIIYYRMGSKFRQTLRYILFLEPAPEKQ